MALFDFDAQDAGEAAPISRAIDFSAVPVKRRYLMTVPFSRRRRAAH